MTFKLAAHKIVFQGCQGWEGILPTALAGLTTLCQTGTAQQQRHTPAWKAFKESKAISKLATEMVVRMPQGDEAKVGATLDCVAQCRRKILAKEYVDTLPYFLHGQSKK